MIDKKYIHIDKLLRLEKSLGILSRSNEHELDINIEVRQNDDHTVVDQELTAYVRELISINRRRGRLLELIKNQNKREMKRTASDVNFLPNKGLLLLEEVEKDESSGLIIPGSNDVREMVVVEFGEDCGDILIGDVVRVPNALIELKLDQGTFYLIKKGDIYGKLK